MKKPTLLKQFKYSIPPSVIALAEANKNHITTEHLPLMKVVIDFENGNLKLQGDWHFMMASNKYNEPGCSNNHKERVQIETTIHASSPINLKDPENDGLVFPMDGTIKDGNSLGACSDLVVLGNVRGLNGLISDQWNISFYLYDQQFNDCEIKFKLPIFITSDSENKN